MPKTIVCSACTGQGKIFCYERGETTVGVIDPCPQCAGKGTIVVLVPVATEPQPHA